MNAKEKFDQCFQLTKLCLLTSGIQIDTPNSNGRLNRFINRYLFYLLQFCLYLCLVGEILNIIDSFKDKEKTFEEISLLIPCVTISILATVKATPLYLQREVLTNILEELKDIHPEVPDDEMELAKDQETTKDAMAHLNTVRRLYLILSISVLFPFCFLPLMLMAYEHYTLGVTEIKLPFAVKFFFDTDKPAIWPFVYFHQVISTLVVTFNIVGVDMLFYGICTFIQMHFRILCCRLEDLFPQKWDARMKNATKMKLRALVLRHQLLIELVKQVEKLFSSATLFNFVTSSFLICLSVFNVTSIMELRAITSFLGFLCMSLFQILICCYGGDIIMQSSKEISVAAYNTRWYIADEDIKKSILIIHYRAQRPCKLTAAKFSDLNLSAFATVLQRSWSYLTLLKTIYQ